MTGAGERPAWRPTDYLWIAAGLACAAAAVELVILGVRHFALHHFIWSSKHLVWMAPASYLAFFLPPAAAAAVVAWRLPRLAPLGLLAGVYAGVSVAALLRLLGNQRIHWVAVAIVGVGAGIRVVSLVAARHDQSLALARRTTLVLGSALAVVAGISEGWWALAERRAVRALPAASAESPNILFLLLDTVRAASLGLYGYGRPTTPALERLAQRGVVFDRAIATAPWTLQSHASFFTGRLPHDLSPDFLTPLDGAHPTLAEVLRDHGYLTAGFAANHAYVSWETGLARGFIHYEDYRISAKQVLQSSELGQVLSDWGSQLILRANDRSAAPVENAALLRWLPRAQSSGRPFFAFVNYLDAHLPYQTPWEWERRFATPGPGRHIVDHYDAAVAYLDDAIGNLVAALEARGTLRNTVIIVSSDHGEQLGEHGLEDHGNSLYIQLLHVPLLVVGVPGGTVPAGTRVADPVSLRDLPATVLSLAGVPQSPIPGRSLQRFWTGGGGAAAGRADSVLVAEVARHPSGAHHPSWRNGRGPMTALFRAQDHYIKNPDGREELFDYWLDTNEERDLAGTPEGTGLLPAFRLILDAIPHM